MGKKEIAKNTGIDLFIQALQSGVENYGHQLIETSGLEVSKQILGGIALETGSSLLPIVGNAISSYRTNKKISNLEQFIKEIYLRLDVISNRLEQANIEDKQVYSELLDYAYFSAESYNQKEKIKFLVNGLETIIMTDDISFDIAYLYIDTLNSLTLLDIAVIKLYNNNYSYLNNPENEVDFESYDDILKKFKIEIYQYEAVRDNLYNRGLLQRKNEKNIKKDFRNIKESLERLDNNITSLHSDISDILIKNKRNAKIKKLKPGKIKFETNDNYIVSNFGREFFKYFLNNETT